MYEVLNAVLQRKLVSVVGVQGVGRGSLVTALAGYIQERRNTTGFSTIFFVRPSKRLGKNSGSFILRLHRQLVKTGWIDERVIKEIGPGEDEEEVMESILNCFRPLTSSKRVLIVFNHIDEEGDLVDFRMFLSQLFTETRYVKVLCTSEKEIGLRGGGAGEYVYNLPPLTFYNSVRLFARLCPQVHTGVDRKALVDLLVDDAQGSITFNGEGVNQRTMDIFKLIGDGFPNKVFDCAYGMTVDDFKILWQKGVRSIGNEGELKTANDVSNFSDSDSDSIGG